MLNKIASLKRWLTLEDASNHLSLIFNETVSRKDLIQLALERHFILSVYFPSPVTMVLYKENSKLPKTMSLLRETSIGAEASSSFLLEFFYHANWGFSIDGKIMEPDFHATDTEAGLWNLPMIERTVNSRILSKDIQDAISECPQKEADKTSKLLGPLLLEHPETHELWGLISYKKLSEDENTSGWKSRDFFNFHQCLPASASLVISQSQLRKFIDSVSDSEQSLSSSNNRISAQEYPQQLESLTIAWRKFWQNADPTDRTACPKKPDVVAWLIEQGFSAKNADAGATIIKPQWAIEKGW